LLDTDPDAEAIRNILVSPLAGYDPSAVLDVQPLAKALDTRLRQDKSLHRLPAKFLFLIDDSGLLPLPIEKADIAFVARKSEGTPVFTAHLGGVAAGACAVEDLCESAVRLAESFLDLRTDSDRRVRDVVRRIGPEALARRAGLAALSPNAQREPASRVLGLHSLGMHKALGIGIPFGRLTAETLELLADEAAVAHAELRLAPWRAIFLLAESIAPDLLDRLHAAGFILDDAAPIRAVAACAGKPACLHGETPAQEDAAHLAPLVAGPASKGTMLHVSGCAKGCAHQERTPLTLVGRDGAYDLVLDGLPADAPIRRSLSLADIVAVLPELLCETAS
jgi:precorrin-3B synthase